MSRIAYALASGALVGLMSLSVAAAPAVTKNGMPVAPNGGNTSIHQWGGMDDTFAVSPDGDEDAAAPKKLGSTLHSQSDAEDDDDPGDPDADHDGEVLSI